MRDFDRPGTPPFSGLQLSSVERLSPRLYLAVALIVTSLLCLLTAPFFVPDEANQSCRAISLSHGQLIPLKPGVEAGAQIDVNALAAMDGINDLRMEWESASGDFRDRRYGALQASRERSLANIRWAHRTVFVPFGNTAVYPPSLYLPAMAGWRLGEAADLTIFASLRLARLFTAWSAVALGWLALRLCACSRWVVLPQLLLPSTLFLNAGCSQDALALSLAALMVALLSRPLVAARAFTTGELGSMAALVALCGTARPPYAGLALLLFLPAVELRQARWRSWLAAAGAFLGALAACALWRHLVAPLGLDWSDEADPERQQAFLRAHPFSAGAALVRGTVEAGTDFFHRGLYVIGWNDLLPHHGAAALLTACLAVIVLLAPGCPLRSWRGRLLLAVAVAAPLLGISLAEYIIWTPPGFHTVYGIQPRYWLPLLALTMLLLVSRRAPRWPSEPMRAALLASATVALAATSCTLPLLAARAFYGEGVANVLRLHLR